MLGSLAFLLASCLLAAPAAAETVIVQAGRLIADAAKRPLGPSTIELVRMAPAEAISSATTAAAKLLDLEREVGQIAPGFSADLIAVTGDPLRDVRVLQKVDYVMIRGRTVD
jgi:predicted amidohydrolase YtcJ